MPTPDLGRGAWLEVATKRHARELGRTMRAKDRDECVAVGNLAPEAAVRMSINNSLESYALYTRGNLLMVFGVGPLADAPGVFVVWAMTSVHADKYPIAFWRCSKIMLDRFRDRYPLMLNMVHGRNTAALRWVERLGFEVGPPEHFGAHSDLFCRAMLVTNKILVAHV